MMRAARAARQDSLDQGRDEALCCSTSSPHPESFDGPRAAATPFPDLPRAVRPDLLRAGWRSLLGELSASTRRVRAAKGGHIGPMPGGALGSRCQSGGGVLAPSPPPPSSVRTPQGGVFRLSPPAEYIPQCGVFRPRPFFLRFRSLRALAGTPRKAAPSTHTAATDVTGSLAGVMSTLLRVPPSRWCVHTSSARLHLLLALRALGVEPRTPYHTHN